MLPPRWLILSLLSVEIDMMMTWLAPLDLADREATVLQVREGGRHPGLDGGETDVISGRPGGGQAYG